MDEKWIIGLAITAVITLIGIIYKIVTKSIDKNTSDIERVDKETDDRLDIVEKDIVKINTTLKIEK